MAARLTEVQRTAQRNLEIARTGMSTAEISPPDRGLTVATVLQHIESRSAFVGIIGMGYAGLPIALAFAEGGYRVLGFDTDPDKIRELVVGHSYIQHISPSRIQPLVRTAGNGQGWLMPTTEFTLLHNCDVILICVPTPLTESREPDLSFVVKTATTVASSLRAGQLVVLESTSYPGTTQEVVQPILEDSGLQTGIDFFLAYSPEREDPNNREYTIRTIPKVVAGCSPACLQVATALYGSIVDRVIPVSAPRVAEAAKLLENIYRSVNIALVNELKVLFDRMGIDIWEVIEAASTKPFGFTPFYPGPGLGGHCIPIDPFYLTWKARQHGLVTRFIELAGEINTAMPDYVLAKVIDALNQRGKALKGSQVFLIGVSYKRDLDDTRESPAFRLIELLQERGALVVYHDPHVRELRPSRKYRLSLASVDLAVERLRRADVTVILTDHSGIDYGLVAAESQLVIDTRNATRHVAGTREKIVKA